MRHTSHILLVLLVLGSCEHALSGCLYTDSVWASLKKSRQRELLEEADIAHMTARCFPAYFARVIESHRLATDTTESPIHSLREFCAARNGFDRYLLGVVAGMSLPGVRTRDVLDLWERYNGRMRGALAKLEDRGDFRAADSLYEAFHQLGVLDFHDLLKWAQARGVLRDYVGASGILCVAARQNPRLAEVARSRFLEQLKEADDSALRRASLNAYENCAIGLPGSDTLAECTWLSRAYGHFSLYDDEVRVIVDYRNSLPDAAQRLLALARRRFSRRLYADAIAPARAAWELSGNRDLTRESVVILSHSYAQVGPRDSALIWVQEADLNSDRSLSSAVALYQEAGLLRKADSLIRRMHITFARDTLTIRQEIFSGKPAGAQEHANALIQGTTVTGLRREARLWQIRLAVFGGDIEATARAIDSLVFAAGWAHAHEVLGYRLAMELLQSYPQAFAQWGRIRCAAFTGRFLEVETGLHADRWPANVGAFLAEALVEALMHAGLFEQAYAVLAEVRSDSLTPRLLFYKARIEFAGGRLDSARKLLETIVLDKSGGVFTRKARMYLLGLEEAATM